MLTSVIFKATYEGDHSMYFATLPVPVIGAAIDAPLVIQKITGLEPVDAVVNTRGYGSLDGEFYTGSHIGKRNIVVTFGLNSRLGPVSISEARNLIYAHLAPKSLTTMQFVMDDHETVEIMGHVESIVGDRFSSDGVLTVSIICHKPNFTGITEQVITGVANVAPAYTSFLYSGDQTAGLTFEMDFSPMVMFNGSLFLDTGNTGFAKKFELTNPYLPPTITLFMNSKRGSKVVEYRIPGYTPPSTVDNSASLLKYMSLDSLWPYLIPGLNEVRVRTPGSAVNRNWTMKFFPEFGGI